MKTGYFFNIIAFVINVIPLVNNQVPLRQSLIKADLAKTISIDAINIFLNQDDFEELEQSSAPIPQTTVPYDMSVEQNKVFPAASNTFTWTIASSEPYGTQVEPLFLKNVRGQGKHVAVLDSGISDHVGIEMLQQLGPGYDFVSDPDISNDGDGRDSDPTEIYNPADDCLSASYHGTKVASIITGANHSVAPESIVHMIRVLGACGNGYAADVSDAIEWASGGQINGIQNINTPISILSLSFVGDGPCPSYVQAAIDHAIARGARIVISAGNDAINISDAFPPNCNGVIVIGASGRDGSFASFSNYGNILASAPGVNVPISTHDGTITFGSGTSYSAPHFSAMLALGVPLLRKPLSACTKSCGQGVVATEFDTFFKQQVTSTSIYDTRINMIAKNLLVFGVECYLPAPGSFGYVDTAFCRLICFAGYEYDPLTKTCVPCKPKFFKSVESEDMCKPQSVPGNATIAWKTLYCGPGTYFSDCNTTADARCLPCTMNPTGSNWQEYATNADFLSMSTYCNWKCNIGYFNWNKTRY